MLKLVFLNVIFYVSFILFSAIWIPLLTLLVGISAIFTTHRSAMRRFRRAISRYGLVIIKVLPFPLIRVHYKDCSNDPVPPPYIFVSNHRSSSDPFLMGCLPYEIIQVVNDWPFRLPVLGIYAKWAGYLSVNEMPFEEFSRRARDLLNQGVSIVAFPEGTRSGSKAMGQFHGGIFRVALEAGYPIVPLCISGNEHIPSRGSLVLRPGTIRVHKLPPLRWAAYKEMKPYKLKNRVREIIAREIASMEGEE